MKLVMFSKHLAELSIEEAARRAGEIGFEGLDLTVREGGHIQPADAVAALPPAVERVRQMGYDIPMITTGITSAEDPNAEDVFRAASAAGVRDLKLGYWRYEGFGSMRRQIEEVRDLLDGIAELASKYQVRANLHIHSDDFVTAEAPVVWQLLLGRDPDVLGAYIDPGHMTVEGGGSGWKMGMDLLTPWINLVAIKSMGWFHHYDETMGQEKWVAKLVPLSQGLVPWKECFGYLREIGFDGTVSVHSEYQGSHSWRDLNLEELVAQTGEDLTFLKKVIAEVYSEQ